MVSLRYFCLSGVSHTVSATTALISASKFCRQADQRWSIYMPNWQYHRKLVAGLTLSMALPTFDTLPWMSLCREASICTVSLIFLQHWAIVWDRTDKSASCTPEKRQKVFTVYVFACVWLDAIKHRLSINNKALFSFLKGTLNLNDHNSKISFNLYTIYLNSVQSLLPNATSCPRISQTLRKSSSSLSSDWWPYITKRWSTFSSSRSTHAHCSMIRTGTLTHTTTTPESNGKNRKKEKYRSKPTDY